MTTPVVLCAGPGEGRECPHGAIAPRSASCPSVARRRGGEPWRCVSCAHDREGERRRGANHWTARITSCPQGHAYDEANTLRYRQRRYCRRCQADRQRARSQRQRDPKPDNQRAA